LSGTVPGHEGIVVLSKQFRALALTRAILWGLILSAALFLHRARAEDLPLGLANGRIGVTLQPDLQYTMARSDTLILGTRLTLVWN
jgi:hypothetical protein